MSPSKRPIPLPPPTPSFFPGRDGLGAYLASPESFHPSRIIYHNADFVAINDLYPKSSIHLLLLPRDPTKTHLHPFTALADPTFLLKVQSEVTKLRHIVATELRRRYGKFSIQDRAREEALNTDPPPPELPGGRDWEREVVAGVHARPSMRHLHVHVLSVDRVSAGVRHRKHYNSFATPFLVGVGEFPLGEGDVRWHPGREGYLGSDLRCWRCGRNFGGGFKALKRHLEGEFEEWKRE